MRITCPNCDAQYEVPTSVIPVEGRDVECSNCGQTWYQYHPDHMPEVPEDSDEAVPPPESDTAGVVDPGPDTVPPEADVPQQNMAQNDVPQQDVAEDSETADDADDTPAPRPAPRQRRALDPDVADILREEAAREQAARAAEPLEMQTDLNLDPVAPSAAPPPLAAPKPRSDAPAQNEPNPLREPTSRRELLPDIEEINSTLRSKGDRDAAGDDPSPDAPLKSRQKRSFRRGFVLSVGLIVLAALAYRFAPDITEALPQAGPALERYSAAVDDARLWLNGQVMALTAWLETQAAASGS